MSTRLSNKYGWTKLQIEKGCKLGRAGHTAIEIALETGMSIYDVKGMLTQMGYENNKGRWKLRKNITGRKSTS